MSIENKELEIILNAHNNRINKNLRFLWLFIVSCLIINLGIGFLNNQTKGLDEENKIITYIYSIIIGITLILFLALSLLIIFPTEKNEKE